MSSGEAVASGSFVPSGAEVASWRSAMDVVSGMNQSRSFRSWRCLLGDHGICGRIRIFLFLSGCASL